jgi:hypothetical protein
MGPARFHCAMLLNKYSLNLYLVFTRPNGRSLRVRMLPWFVAGVYTTPKTFLAFHAPPLACLLGQCNPWSCCPPLRSLSEHNWRLPDADASPSRSRGMISVWDVGAQGWKKPRGHHCSEREEEQQGCTVERTDSVRLLVARCFRPD